MLHLTQEKIIDRAIDIFEEFVEDNTVLFKSICLDINTFDWVFNKSNSNINIKYTMEEKQGIISLKINHIDNMYISLDGKDVTNLSEFIEAITMCNKFNHSSIFDDLMYSLITECGYIRNMKNETIVKYKSTKVFVNVVQFQNPHNKWEFIVSSNCINVQLNSYSKLKKYLLEMFFK